MIPTSRQNHSIETLPISRVTDLTAAADLLADAFLHGNNSSIHNRGGADPFYNRRNNGDEKVRDLFRSIIDVASKKGHAITVVRNEDKQIVGASWVKERNITDLTLSDFPKLVMPAIRAFGFIGALCYGWDVLNHIPIYPTNITYISMVAVAKSSQRTGIGKTLIQHAIDGASGKDIVLSTMNPQNVILYEKLGFHVEPSKQTVARECMLKCMQRPGFTTFHMAYKASK